MSINIEHLSYDSDHRVNRLIQDFNARFNKEDNEPFKRPG